jgi:hypothetical protein
VDVISPSDFVVLWAALYQEFRIVIYGENIEKVTSIILCLHFLIYHIKWTSTSISHLPESLFVDFDSPRSHFYGITNKNKKTESLQSNTIFVDIESKTLTATAQPIHLPGDQESILKKFE